MTHTVLNTAENVGAGVPIFKQKSADKLQLRSLEQDSQGITYSLVGDKIKARLSLLLKEMENKSGQTIAAGQPVSKKADGSIILGDSDLAGAQTFIGVTLQEILNDAIGTVALVGPNIIGAIAGLGYAPGDDVFVSETGGYTNDPNSFTGSNDTITRVGFADCAAGSASSTATDLILFSDIIVSP